MESPKAKLQNKNVNKNEVQDQEDFYSGTPMAAPLSNDNPVVHVDPISGTEIELIMET